MITGLFKKNPPFDLEEEKDVYFIRGYFYRAENDKEKELVNKCVSIEDCVVQAENDSDPVALFFEAIKEYCHNLDVKYYPKIKPYIVQRHENSISVRWKEQTLEEGYELVVFELTQVDRVITLKREGGKQ